MDENIPIEIDYEFEMAEDEEEEEPAEEEEEDDEGQIEESEDELTTPLSIEEIIVKLHELAASDKPQRKEVDAVKAQFIVHFETK